MSTTPTIRRARESDAAAVAAFTDDTWADRDVTDYVPDAFAEWVGDPDEDHRTLVADVREDTFPAADPGDVVGLARVSRLTPWEAWASAMRVAPDHRGRGVSGALTEALFEWARERGCVVCRNMTFSWNGPALGASRRVGFDPCTEVRFARPAPDADAAAPGLDGDPRPDGAWAFWTDSAARDHLRGLAVDADQSWALSTLTRERLRRAAAEGRLVTVDGGRGGFAERVRTFEREGDADSADASAPLTYAEYAVAAWPAGDADAAGAVFGGVARDAAGVGADRTRVLLPEGVTWASDAAAAGVGLWDEPSFVLSARL
jgi:GNAT superfamily N-acetyltransferase